MITVVCSWNRKMDKEEIGKLEDGVDTYEARNDTPELRLSVIYGKRDFSSFVGSMNFYYLYYYSRD